MIRSGAVTRRGAAVAVAVTLLAGCTNTDRSAKTGASTTIAPMGENEVDLAANPGALRKVPDKLRPVFRWWWPTDDLDPAEIVAELKAMKDAGFGAVEQVLLRNNKRWGSPRFLELTKIALEEANRLGLRFDITLGPSWPMSSPAVDDVSKGLSSQALHYGAVDLTGPQQYNGAIPDAATGVPDQPKQLISVVAMRIADGAGTLDPTSAVALTGRASNGKMTWNVPEGNWRLFGFWMRPSFMRSKAIGGGEPGWLVVDHFSRTALDAVLADYDRMLFNDLAPQLTQNGGDVFEDSYEIETGPSAPDQSAIMWTPKMLDEFAARRGYDLAPLLPALFAEVPVAADTSARVGYDFRVTSNDLLIANHIQPIASWANEKGLHSRSQTYKGGLGAVGTDDNNRLAAAAEKPDVETLGFGDPTFGQAQPVALGSPDGRAVINRYRQVVTGAHISGATEITNEWGAVNSGQFAVDPDELVALANRSMAAGVTRMALHGFAYRDFVPPEATDAPRPLWPGWCAWCGRGLEFADSWNQSWPQLSALPGLNEYLTRSTAVLESGTPRVDVVVVDDHSVVNGILAAPTAGTPDDLLRTTLQRSGYTWDTIDATTAASVDEVKDGRLLPDGPGYRALVVNDLATLPVETATNLATLAESGLPIILLGHLPTASPGAEPDGDRKLLDAIAGLTKNSNVRIASDPTTLVAALRELGAAADLWTASPTSIVPVHRRTATGDVWYLYNDSPKLVSTEVTFAADGNPSEINLWTGVAEPVASRAAGGSVTLRVTLGPGATTVFVFGPSTTTAQAEAEPTTAAGATGPTADLDPRPITVAGPWRLRATTVSPGGKQQVTLDLVELRPWSDVPELRGRSGTATYDAEVTIPKDWLDEGHRVLLDPGAFGGALRAWVNDEHLSIPVIARQNPINVARQLHAGKNRLRLEITSTLNNAMVTLGQAGDPAYAEYAQHPLDNAGLVGPVRLTPAG